MINYQIQSENSCDHWKYFDPKEKVVLDLGCGRHCTDSEEHHSSTYFINEGALRVFAIDSRQSEIDYYNSLNINNLIAEQITIDSVDKLLYLIQNNQITAIKCDIEGYETLFYDITKEQLENVVEFGLEYHDLDILEKMTKKIEEWGFTIHTSAKFGFCEAPHMGVLFCKK